MITYEKLWETLKIKGVSQYQLIHKYNISAGQLSRLRANIPVNISTVDRLCQILHCPVEDIITYHEDQIREID